MVVPVAVWGCGFETRSSDVIRAFEGTLPISWGFQPTEFTATANKIVNI